MWKALQVLIRPALEQKISQQLEDAQHDLMDAQEAQEVAFAMIQAATSKINRLNRQQAETASTVTLAGFQP